jgi:formate dehydrogenase major subunit
MMYPDYQRVASPDARAKFERLWNTKLDDTPGLTVVEIMDAVHDDRIRGMYVMGENPAMSDPDVQHARAALAHLEMLIVQDIFLTETAYLADVVLPASAFPEKTGTFTNTDRLVQLGRQALEPPGDARQDLWIIQQIAKGVGLDWHYAGPHEVFDEMRRAMPSIGGITWQRLGGFGRDLPGVAEASGDRVVFTERDRVGPWSPGAADIIPQAERMPVPMVLITAASSNTAHRQHDAAGPGSRRDRAGAGRASIRSPGSSARNRHISGRVRRAVAAPADDGVRAARCSPVLLLHQRRTC